MQATTPLDDRLSCDHLRAERSVNDARIADLVSERSQARTDNAAWIVAAPVMLPVFLDLSETEKKEIVALQNRNTMLDRLIAEKCPKPPSAGDAPAAHQP